MGLAVFGGTFDPIHIGHLIIAEQTCNFCDVEQVIFMPAGIPPHKSNNNVSSKNYRLEMVQLATADNQHFSCSELEFVKEGNSYTVDTLKEMQRVYPGQKIYFLIGADSLLDIYNWKQPEYLLENANFIVARRSGFSLKDIYVDERFRKYRKNIKLLDNSLIDISSSQIRKLRAAGKSIRYLVLPEVAHYIKTNDLYLECENEKR